MKNIHIQDPLYGFINIPEEKLQALIAHPYLQRLRRITQLGLSELVYPSAVHNRFQHALGTLHLMRGVIKEIRKQGTIIEKEEKEAALIAALLHDIGHGPFSHGLEKQLLTQPHERIGLQLMHKLADELGINISLTQQMLTGSYSRPFFHQLLVGDLDVDRMDYLHRDSFFTGVAEGHININRLLAILYVEKEQLHVKCKGIPTVEDFFHARRMMYLQVYRHKTGLIANYMLKAAIQRARTLVSTGYPLDCPLPLQHLLTQVGDEQAQLHDFTTLHDTHLWVSLQSWINSSDKALSLLCRGLCYRKLFSARINEQPFPDNFIPSLREGAKKLLNLQGNHSDCVVGQEVISLPQIKERKAYNHMQDLSVGCSQWRDSQLSSSTRLYCVYYPKQLDETHTFAV